MKKLDFEPGSKHEYSNTGYCAAFRSFESGKLDSGGAINYAYGWAKDECNGHSMVAHSGSWVGFRSFVVNIPDQKLWVALFSNYRGLSVWDSTKAVLDEFLRKP